MKMPYFRATVAAMIAVAGFAFCLPARASTFTVGGSGNTFTVSRSGAGVAAAETVRYRTVPLSAFPGQHYTEKSGTLVFAPGQTTTNVVVSESSPTAGTSYAYQTADSRAYRFEVADAGGFLVTNATRTLTTGTRVTASDAFGVKNLTIQSSEYTADDRGYDNNGYKSVSSNGYFAAAAPRPYFQLVNAQLRMTLTPFKIHSTIVKQNELWYYLLQPAVRNCGLQKKVM